MDERLVDEIVMQNRMPAARPTLPTEVVGTLTLGLKVMGRILRSPVEPHIKVMAMDFMARADKLMDKPVKTGV